MPVCCGPRSTRRILVETKRTLPLEFGPFRFDPADARLWRGTEAIRLPPKALAVLEVLVRHPGQLVSKDALLAAVWPGVAVGDAVLAVNIRALREALGDSSRVPRFIETVHRLGYRFVALLGGSAASPAPALTTTPWSTAASDAVPATPEPTSRSNAVTTPRPRPLVIGRDAPLRQLRGCLDRALTGERQLVFVSGEPGVGKTTLLDAFVASLGERAPLSTARSQCIDHQGIGEPYLPVLDALGQLARQLPGGQMVALLDRHAPSWLAHLPSLLDATERDALDRRLHGVTPERMLREIAEALEILAAERPVILLLEDLHWSDGATLDLLAWLARRRAPARLLLIATYRPVDVILRGHPLRGLKQELGAHGLCMDIPLELLSEAQVAQYLDLRWGAGAVPATLPALLHRRTGGNPLFLVTVLEGLGPRDAPTERADVEARLQHVPETLRGAIERQLALCEADEREILEAASVVGLEFAAAAVAAAAGRSAEAVEGCCARLAHRGQFLEEGAIEEWPDGTVTATYRFRHALHQQAAYERIATGQRLRLHRQIGLRLEAAHGEAADEHAVDLAWHFAEARMPERAAFHLRQAGESAIRRSAYREAAALVRRGLEWLTPRPGATEQARQRLELCLTLGTALLGLKSQTDPEVEQAFGEARAFSEHLAPSPQLFRALVGLRKYYVGCARLTSAANVADQSLRVAEQLAAPELLMEAHYGRGNASFWSGDLAGARAHLEQALALHTRQRHEALRGHVDLDAGVGSLMYLAVILWLQGFPEQARERSLAAVALATDLGHPGSLALAHLYAAKIHQLRREADATAHEAASAIAISEQHGFAWWRADAAHRQGWAMVMRGERAGGVALMHQSLVDYQATGGEVGRPYDMALLAEAHASHGDVGEAARLLEAAGGLIDATGEAWCAAEVRRLEGEILAQRGEHGDEVRAAACFHEAIETARRQGARSWELRTAVSLARLWRRQAKGDEGRRLVADVHRTFTEGFDTADLEEATALLAGPAERNGAASSSRKRGRR